jgi:hypothetical protein
MGPVAKVLPGYGYRRVGKFWMRGDSPYVTLQGAPPAEEEEPAAGNGGNGGNPGDAGDNGDTSPGPQAQLHPGGRHPRHA